MTPFALLLVLGLVPAGVASAQPARAPQANPPAAVAAPAARPGATTIYHAVMPDGTVLVGDERPGGAASVQVLSYPFPQGRQVDARAEAQRQHWQREAEAFEQRRRERERVAEERRRDLELARALVALRVVPEPVRVAVQGAYEVMPPLVAIPLPVHRAPLPALPAYGGSPGAVQGRDAGFIGSGFAVAR
jgi:hypothetical protein